MRGEIQDRSVFPPSVELIEGGIIIDLKEKDIESDLEQLLDLCNLPSDEDLISHLEILIESHSFSKRIKADPNAFPEQ